MALKATIFKAELQIADMDRNYYENHTLTVARHPSETDERMMVRVLAYAIHADPVLTFGKGLSDDEPDLWLKDLTGVVRVWIDVGLPDEKRMCKACGRAEQVFVYGYGGHGVSLWWDQVSGEVERCRNLTVMQIPSSASQGLAKLAERNMQLNCTIQEGQVWLSNARDSVLLEPEVIKSPAPADY